MRHSGGAKVALVAAIALGAVQLTGCGSTNDAAPTGPTVPTPTPITGLAACSTSGTIQLSVAQAARVDCSNGGGTVTLAGGGASYLVVPQLPVSLVPLTFQSYQLGATGGVSASLVPVNGALASRGHAIAPRLSPILSAALTRPRTRQLSFERALRARAREKVMSGAWRPRISAARSLAAIAPAPPAVGSLRQFRVIADSTGNRFVTVTASLQYAGSNVLVYIDTLSPANGFSPSQLQAFGSLFDQTLYPIDTAAFGPPSDVDQNGRVIMLMTPRVNALSPASQCSTLGFVAGFFNEEDLAGFAGDPNSNNGEVFYSMVPDPLGQSSCKHSVQDVGFDVPATFLHELQHLISFSQHVVVHGGDPEYGWLDEGMSIVAEELGSVYYEKKCPGTSCRTDPSQIFPDSSQGFVSSFLMDSYDYALMPDTASVTLHDDSEDGFSWRGGDWLLMRYLGDQFGSVIFKKLDESPETGVANIELQTGQSFPSLFATFGLAIYTDSLPGFPRTTAPAADRFVSRNLRQLWARFFATSGGDPTVPLAFPLPVHPVTTSLTNTYAIYPGASAYFRLNTAASAPTVTLELVSPGGTALPAGLKPQLAIFRLPPGA